MVNTTEQQVRNYFLSRAGWSVHKLDAGNTAGRAPDFLICHDQRCFLCEVKAIGSVRADIPDGSVLDHFVGRRNERRARIDRYLDENLEKTLLMRQEEWHWLRASDAEFRKRYGFRRRNTEAKFRDHSENPLCEELDKSSVSELPYDLRLDSDDLYVPSKAERRRLVDWLVTQITAIHRGEPRDWKWIGEKRPSTTPAYSARYPLHRPADDYDSEHPLSISLHRRGRTDDGEGLRVDAHCYGALNIERVRSNVKEAVGQLREAASREGQYQRLPRVVVLRFQRALDPVDDMELLEKEIRDLFRQYADLSAIAVLDWRPEGRPPSAEEGILARLRFLAQTPRVRFFRVYHNGWCSDATERLDPEAFSDRWSIRTRVGPQ
jgi:hypothetical protein